MIYQILKNNHKIRRHLDTWKYNLYLLKGRIHPFNEEQFNEYMGGRHYLIVIRYFYLPVNLT